VRWTAFGITLSLAAVLASGCQLAPPYDPPHMLLPDSYRGSGVFLPAGSGQVFSSQQDWWILFGDPLLNSLEERLQHANPTLAAAEHAYAQVRDIAAEAQSRLYPQIGAEALTSDNKQSLHSLYRANGSGLSEEGLIEVSAGASWEPDFWGAIRNRAHERKRLAQAGAADLATAQLSLDALLATNYVGIRGLDAELEVLRASIVSYQTAVDVTRLRTQGAIASGLDLARALSQLRSAQALETDTALQRDQLQHAIAVLVGEMPSKFIITAIPQYQITPPDVPPGLPSKLLERRPDIISAERQMAAANAAIGVSRAAFYPNVTFSAAGGFQGSGINLLSLPNSLWSVGAAAMQPLFEGGLRRAQLQQSWAHYAQTREQYRETVLAAFKEVEDGLSLTQRLSSEVLQQHEASDQAAQALDISTRLYRAGLDSFLSVSVAQVQALTQRSIEIQVRVRQLQAAIALIRALGGGWSEPSLPTEKQVLPFGPLDYDTAKQE
jgi:multidrug efflux system outer membrane protein